MSRGIENMEEKNTPKTFVGDQDVNALRDAYMNRADWIYFLVKEGLDRGLGIDFAMEAFSEVGATLADWSFQDCADPASFVQKLLDFGRGKAQEGIITEQTETAAAVEYGYCPLREAWGKLTEDTALINDLCGACGKMYQGIACARGLKTEHPACFSDGEGKCKFRFIKE